MCATFVADAEPAGKAHDAGYRMIGLGTEFGFVRAAAAATLDGARAATR